MKMFKSLQLYSKYVDCPQCGSSTIGEGQGGIIIEDTYLKRFCKCGFEVVVDEDDNEVELSECSICKFPMLSVELKKCKKCGKAYCSSCASITDADICDDCN